MASKTTALPFIGVLLALLASPAAAQSQTAAAAPTISPAAFTQCLNTLRPQALREGIDDAIWQTHVMPLQADASVLALLDAQPEFTTPLWDYLASLVDAQRIEDGQARLQEHAALLRRVEQGYGVDAATVVAVWGVESDYGRVFGKRPLLTSLATLSCAGRRQAFFRDEFFALVKLIQRGDVNAEGLTGSWAGAFGHTQFMPSTYTYRAVDFDNDGRRDLVGSIPDALASTANYLKRNGWQIGQPWGYEVRLPAGFQSTDTGRTNRKPLSHWLAHGIQRVDGQPIDLPPSTRTALLLPTGVNGPAFLVFKNYDVIYSYNAAESYALAIATLADRLRGGRGLHTPWPTDDPGLSRRERRELQQLLLHRGHAIGEADGMIGSRSRQAILQEQQRLGITPADGRAGQRILQALRLEKKP